MLSPTARAVEAAVDGCAATHAVLTHDLTAARNGFHYAGRPVPQLYKGMSPGQSVVLSPPSRSPIQWHRPLHHMQPRRAPRRLCRHIAPLTNQHMASIRSIPATPPAAKAVAHNEKVPELPVWLSHTVDITHNCHSMVHGVARGVTVQDAACIQGPVGGVQGDQGWCL
jgi:hypothetical protein